jgi:RNA ligase
VKIPLVYPKIPDTTGCPLKKCWVFEKYDGTNMHWDFKKFEFVSFGTRRDTFPFTEEGFEAFAKAHPGLEEAPRVFNKYLEDFLFEYHSGMTATLFTEYLGPNSFAGQHKPGDPMHHIIIDIMKGNKFLSPDKFLEAFESDWATERGNHKLGHAKCIFQGKYSGQLIEDIRNGKYPVNEGAVIKGVSDREVYMAKVKTNTYMEKLKEQFKDNWKDYWE